MSNNWGDIYVHTITTGLQSYVPLPQDREFTHPLSTRIQYREQHQLVYQFINEAAKETAAGSLSREHLCIYGGTVTPHGLDTDIRVYENGDGELRVVFMEGHNMTPPILGNDESPYTTIAVLRQSRLVAVDDDSLAEASDALVGIHSRHTPPQFSVLDAVPAEYEIDVSLGLEGVIDIITPPCMLPGFGSDLNSTGWLRLKKT